MYREMRRRKRMSNVTEIKDSEFDQKVLQSKIPVLVDFWATWCRPCLMAAPIIDELSKEYADKVAFTKINVDENHQAATKYGVMSIPNMIIFKGGKVAAQIVGYRPKSEIKKTLDGVLG